MIIQNNFWTKIYSILAKTRYSGGRSNLFDKGVVILSKRANFFLGNRCKFGSNAIISVDTGKLIIGNNFNMSSLSTIACYGGVIEIGDNCSLNPYSILYGHGNLKIGNFVRIAAHTTIIPANHVFADKNLPITRQGTSKKGIVIEDDCWIGAGVTILDGVTIGKGSVIAAGAVVNEDIPPYSIAGGIPAKILKSRA